ncbi:transcriptional regulator, HxlR family [Chitinophaga terrae (ex Kim and Jung 2007)]|uniref:Transcriptional regulator, HxlR family n=2 Tax=Chitinophaga terrae (ex Kim and Jung 2007) TaxID=408074 RepID=A0A1H4GEY2_9BACT|nr:HxlR family transcriptional regulator [Chitinophaga terrae (ex Kim and Jung 2007)]SEB07580.1 transcriptional regulator, HxlR family [Chitinophaga terrae (ex Kim and Jung 2007)]
MIMRKKQSSNYLNEQLLAQVCERNSAISIVSGRWKSQIVFNIYMGNDRFHLLQQNLPGISEMVLARQLKELESHAILVKRDIPDTVPVGKRYILTNKGLDLVPILDSLCNWGKLYAGGKEITVPSDNQAEILR